MQLTKLADLAEVKSGGGAPQDPSAFSSDGHPFVRAGSLSGLLNGGTEDDLKKLSPEVARSHRLQLFPKGTVLFAKSGMSATKGYIYALQRPSYVVNHLSALIPRDARDSAFLVRALQHFSPTTLIKDQAYPSIRLGDIETMEIVAPPSIDERGRIAAILDKADALRRKRKHAIDLLDSLTQSIFLEMFGDPVSNPRKWPSDRLGSVCDVRDGTHASPKYVDEGFPLLTSKNFSGGAIDYTGAKLISSEDYEEINRRSQVHLGDIVMPMIGTIGSPVLIKEEPAFAIKNVALFKFGKSSPLAEFIIKILDGPLLEAKISNLGRGGTQKFLSLGDLRSLEIPLPPISAQLEFKKISGIHSMIMSSYRTGISAADALFASLGQRAFSGQL